LSRPLWRRPRRSVALQVGKRQWEPPWRGALCRVHYGGGHDGAWPSRWGNAGGIRSCSLEYGHSAYQTETVRYHGGTPRKLFIVSGKLTDLVGRPSVVGGPIHSQPNRNPFTSTPSTEPRSTCTVLASLYHATA